jgi:hypothetical protein
MVPPTHRSHRPGLVADRSGRRRSSCRPLGAPARVGDRQRPRRSALPRAKRHDDKTSSLALIPSIGQLPSTNTRPPYTSRHSAPASLAAAIIGRIGVMPIPPAMNGYRRDGTTGKLLRGPRTRSVSPVGHARTESWSARRPGLGRRVLGATRAEANDRPPRGGQRHHAFGGLLVVLDVVLCRTASMCGGLSRFSEWDACRRIYL